MSNTSLILIVRGKLVQLLKSYPLNVVLFYILIMKADPKDMFLATILIISFTVGLVATLIIPFIH